MLDLKDDLHLTRNKIILDDLSNDPSVDRENFRALMEKLKEPKKSITAMPDSVREALGLPSNAEDNAGLKYRKQQKLKGIS